MIFDGEYALPVYPVRIRLAIGTSVGEIIPAATAIEAFIYLNEVINRIQYHE